MSRCSKCGGDGAAVEGGYCKPCKAAYAKARAGRGKPETACKRCGRTMEPGYCSWCPDCLESHKREAAEVKRRAGSARKEYQRAYHERNKDKLNERSLRYYYEVVKPARDARKLVKAREVDIVNARAVIAL